MLHASFNHQCGSPPQCIHYIAEAARPLRNMMYAYGIATITNGITSLRKQAALSSEVDRFLILGFSHETYTPTHVSMTSGVLGRIRPFVWSSFPPTPRCLSLRFGRIHRRHASGHHLHQAAPRAAINAVMREDRISRGLHLGRPRFRSRDHPRFASRQFCALLRLHRLIGSWRWLHLLSRSLPSPQVL